MNICIKKTKIQGCYILKLPKTEDKRGSFSRLFCLKEIENKKLKFNIRQINYSTNKGSQIVRGIHFQYGLGLEKKIVICLEGKIFDVVVDLRPYSQSYKQVETFTLSSNNKAILIDKGCGHGYQTLKENCKLLYFHSNFYMPKYESGIIYNDKTLGIDWPYPVKQISERDKKFKSLKHFEMASYEM